MQTLQTLVGQRVLNVHRTGGSAPVHLGTILRFDAGCNGGTVVRWDGNNFDSYMVTADLALASQWPLRADGVPARYIRLPQTLSQLAQGA